MCRLLSGRDDERMVGRKITQVRSASLDFTCVCDVFM